MSVLTEIQIRKLVADGLLKEKGEMHIAKGTIITPSARTYLLEKNIEIVEEAPFSVKKEQVRTLNETTEVGTSNNEQTVFETVFGLRLTEKPEHMTHLRGNMLVFKDHPRIALRGAIDSLEAEIIMAQIVASRLGKPKVVEELEECIRFIRKLLRCEVSGEPLGEFILQGLTEKEIREQSYHPSKYFGIKHFLPTYTHGEMVAYLNKLRTMTRKTELIAFKAFKDENDRIEREDIIRAFNRLSSLFWIMMCKELKAAKNV